MNGGEKWDTLTFLRRLSNISFINENNGWALLNDEIIRTNNSGADWKTLTNLENIGQSSTIYFINSFIGFIIGWNHPVLKSNDGGHTWLEASDDNYNLQEMYFFDKNIGWAAGTCFENNENYGHVLRTINAGESWDDIKTEEGQSLNSIFFIDEFVGWAVGSDGENSSGVVIKSIDGGKTWFNIYYPRITPYSVFFINENKGWITTSWGQILSTTNGGLEWEEEFATFKSRGLNSVKFASEKVGWAVGDYGTILKTLNGGLTFIEVYRNANFENYFTLKQNFPNPFNPSTIINFTLSKGSETQLKIYDVLGREIKTLFNEFKQAGKHKTTFNSGNLPSGIYFYRLDLGNYSDTKKMIILR